MGGSAAMNLDELSEWLVVGYGLTRPVACKLLRSYTNDVYEVRSAKGRFVLKVYGKGWRTEPEIRYETALVQHLAARGLPIAGPIPTTRQDLLQGIETPDGRRLAVLYAYAPGRKPRPPFSARLYAAFGGAVAQMHALSDDFVTQYPRRPLDLNLLIDEPLARAFPFLEKPEDREFLSEVARRVKNRITEWAAEGLDWGPIHGDATLDNLHITAEGRVLLYDFDSGGPGWRAADLQGWTANSPRFHERWEAFQRGYAAVRPLKPVDLLAAPYLDVAWDIWGIKIDLDNRIVRQGKEQTQAYLSEQVALLRERARDLLPG